MGNGTFTTNLHLYKPVETDPPNVITDICNNMQAIDEAYGARVVGILNTLQELTTAVENAPGKYIHGRVTNTLANTLTGSNNIGDIRAYKSGQNYIIYDVFNSYGRHYSGWYLISTGDIDVNEVGMTINASSVADILSKIKTQTSRTFTLFADNALTSELCGMSQPAYGTCMFRGGYLCFDITTYNDYKFFGWYKESDGSVKADMLHAPNGLSAKSITKTSVTIPNNDNVTINLSGDVPSGCKIESVIVNVYFPGKNEWWTLPYISESLSAGMWVRRVDNNRLTIRCSDTGWGTCDLLITAFFRKTTT